jgi:hypothetical protein
MRPYVASLTRHGVAAWAVDVPKGKAERAVAALLSAVPPAPDVIAGGRSYGGRVASLAAAQARYGGLVLISYPLHPPGRPDAAEQRTAHWPLISCPVLVLAGDADPFGRPELLRSAVATLPTAELVVYPGGRHGLLAEVDDLAGRIADFVASLAIA